MGTRESSHIKHLEVTDIKHTYKFMCAVRVLHGSPLCRNSAYFDQNNGQRNESKMHKRMNEQKKKKNMIEHYCGHCAISHVFTTVQPSPKCTNKSAILLINYSHFHCICHLCWCFEIVLCIPMFSIITTQYLKWCFIWYRVQLFIAIDIDHV